MEHRLYLPFNIYIMTFKFETKETYTIILPECDVLDVNVAEELYQTIKTDTKFDTQNFIIDATNCQKYDIEANELLLEIHDYVYNVMTGSIVFTNLNQDTYNKIKQERLHLSLNITPTLIEAVDIISMEVLERDLLSEE